MDTEKKSQVKQKAKEVSKTTAKKAGTAWQKIVEFFKNLDRAYYIGALAVIATLLFFSAWVDIAFISAIGEFLKIPAISGKIAIPQTLLSVCTGLDSQATQISGILDYLDVNNIDANQISQIYQTIVAIATMAGVNTAEWAINVNDIVASIQQLFPDPVQIYTIKAILAQIASYAKIGGVAVFILCAIVVGFNIYTIVVTFKNKKVTKMCKVGFIIELIISALVIIGCNCINSFINSKIFFINNVFVPTFWCWFTLILCIIAFIVVCKITKKQGQKFNKKRAGITVGIIIAVIVIVCIVFGINENNKKQPFIGNWNVANIEKEGILDQAQLKEIQDKGYDLSKSVVITIKQDGTYDESILGHLVQGRYEVVPEGIALFPKDDFDNYFAKVVLKEKNGKLTASLGLLEIAQFAKGDSEAKCVSQEIQKAVGMTAIDYVLKFAGIQDMTAEDVVNSFNELGEVMQKLNSVDQNEIARQIKDAIGAELQNAYNKLNDKQKEAVSTIYYIIINS